MKLYYHPLSGHSHRARLLLSLLDVRHELVLVDLAVKAQKQTDFLALNPFGQLPVLDDDGMIIADSNAIMVYVAKKWGALIGCRRLQPVPLRCSAGCRSLRVRSPTVRQWRA